jgi:hypothetical protein
MTAYSVRYLVVENVVGEAWAVCAVAEPLITACPMCASNNTRGHSHTFTRTSTRAHAHAHAPDDVPDGAPEIDVELSAPDELAAALLKTTHLPPTADVYLQVCVRHGVPRPCHIRRALCASLATRAGSQRLLLRAPLMAMPACRRHAQTAPCAGSL